MYEHKPMTQIECNWPNYLYVKQIDDEIEEILATPELTFKQKEEAREGLLDVQNEVMELLYLN